MPNGEEGAGKLALLVIGAAVLLLIMGAFVLTQQKPAECPPERACTPVAQEGCPDTGCCPENTFYSPDKKACAMPAAPAPEAPPETTPVAGPAVPPSISGLVGGENTLFPESPYTPGPTAPCTGMLCELWETWAPVAWITILTSMFIVALAYMVGKGFGMREIEVWGKEELYQAIASAVILGSFMGVVVLTDQTARQMANDVLYAGATLPQTARPGEAAPAIVMQWQYDGDGRIRWSPTGTRRLGAGTACGVNDPYNAGCHFYLARAFLGATFEKLISQAAAVTRLYWLLAFLDNMFFTLGFNYMEKFGFSLSMSPWGGNSIFYDTLESPVFTTMVKTLLFLKFQEIALMYIERGVFPAFMVLGLVLRALWITRKLGGLLIALAIGFYTVWPLMYVLDWYTMDASMTSINMEALDRIAEQGSYRGSTEYTEKEQGNIDIGSVTKTLFTQYRPDNSVEYYGMLDTAGRYAFIAFAAPVINLFVFIGFARGLSAFLGGDVEIAGLTKLI